VRGARRVAAAHERRRAARASGSGGASGSGAVASAGARGSGGTERGRVAGGQAREQAQVQARERHAGQAALERAAPSAWWHGRR
jgi:hypothetical protein